MIPISRLKKNLDFNKNLGELIEVMKLASTLRFNQFRFTQQVPEKFSRFFEEIIKCTPPDISANDIYFQPRPSLPSIIVLISSDEGFIGDLNALLVNKMLELRQEQDKIIVLGQQGEHYLQDLDIDFKLLPSVTDKVNISQVESLRDDVLNLYSGGGFSRVWVVCANFLNITSQQIESEQLLPLSETYFYRGMEKTAGVPQKAGLEFLFEPDAGTVIEGWVRLWLVFRFYQFFWSSKLAEFAARVMHLEGSIQELNKVNQRLRLEYFKYLHSLSDKTIREISASRLKTSQKGFG